MAGSSKPRTSRPIEFGCSTDAGVASKRVACAAGFFRATEADGLTVGPGSWSTTRNDLRTTVLRSTIFAPYEGSRTEGLFDLTSETMLGSQACKDASTLPRRLLRWSSIGLALLLLLLLSSDAGDSPVYPHVFARLWTAFGSEASGGGRAWITRFALASPHPGPHVCKKGRTGSASSTQGISMSQRFNVVLPDDVSRQLEQLAIARETTNADIMARALELYAAAFKGR